VVGFVHEIPEDAPGADLAPDSARALAEAQLRGPLAVDLSRLEFLDVKTEKRPHRTDHTFTWKQTGMEWRGGDYRYEVRIQGDQPGGFREYVKIPEEWSREYARLRSKNDSTAAVAGGLDILTYLAILIVLLVRIRLRDVRWRTAFLFGGIGAVLVFLAGLNLLPGSLYRYDTTVSFGGFLISRLFYTILAALGAGLLFLVMTAAAEPLYREAYPAKVSLSGFFTRRGLRTRRFLLSVVLGLTLTCFFFCYQEAFYTVALKLGAWAPMEVPYDDLLNTAIPWAFLLIIGFFPAVNEEFSARLFSIPFLRKYTRSAALAVILPALIWGFSHANYPNQPFYIRGVEVGLAGILVGLVMTRFNILATLIWHYTVDALYTGYLLFRSGKPYFVVSAALAGGLMLVPLGYAVVSYLRRGRFEEPEGLLNRDEPGPIPVAAKAPEEAPEIVPVAEEVRPPATWSTRRRATVLLAAVVSLLLLLLPASRIDDAARPRVARSSALAEARRWLNGLGEDPASFRSAVAAQESATPLGEKYILQQAGTERLREEAEKYLPPRRWLVRFYRPLETREYKVQLAVNDGRLMVYERHIAEDDSLPSLPLPEAQSLASRFLETQRVDLSLLELKEAASEKQPHRMDHTFLWEAREGDPRNVGQARHRVSVVVQGDQVGGYQQFLKLPEDWVRQRQQRTAVGSIRLILQIAAAGTIVGLLLWLLISGHRAGVVRWRRALLLSIPYAALAFLGAMNGWPEVQLRYDTSIPWNVYLVTILVGLGISVVLGYLAAVISVALATTGWPQAWTLKHARVRRELLPDAFLAAAAGVVLALVLDHLEWTWLRLWPAQASPPELSMPSGASSLVPWFGAVYHAVRGSVLAIAAVAGVLALLRLRSQYRGWTALVVALGAIALVPPAAKTTGEFGVGLLAAAVDLAAWLAFARWLAGRNWLAYPLLIYALASLRMVLPYLRTDSPEMHAQGWIGAALLSLPVLWLVLSARRADGSRSRGSFVRSEEVPSVLP
jgi:hypothetical protein